MMRENQRVLWCVVTACLCSCKVPSVARNSAKSSEGPVAMADEGQSCGDGAPIGFKFGLFWVDDPDGSSPGLVITDLGVMGNGEGDRYVLEPGFIEAELGLRVGDRIISVDRVAINDRSDLRRAIEKIKVCPSIHQRPELPNFSMEIERSPRGGQEPVRLVTSGWVVKSVFTSEGNPHFFYRSIYRSVIWRARVDL